MYRAMIAGHLCVDLVPKLDGPVPGPGALAQAGPIELRLGGCVANTGLALSALGAPVELVALLGEDLLGDAVAAMLEAVPLHKLRVQRIPGPGTSYSIVLQPPATDRTFLHHVGTNAAFDGTEVTGEDTDLLHVGYPQLLPRLLDDGGAGLDSLLARARRGGVTTSVDFAKVDRARAADHPWPALMSRWAPLIDVLTPSLDDLWPAFPTLAVEGGNGGGGNGSGNGGHDAALMAARMADELVRGGVAVAVVTAGSAGMCLRTGGPERFGGGGRLLAALPPDWFNRQLWAPSSASEPVRTTGAGDTATAGFLYGILAGLPADEALTLAAAAAALHVTGVAPLPDWQIDRSVYDSITFPSMDIEGWTRTPLGLLQGPADRKGIT